MSKCSAGGRKAAHECPLPWSWLMRTLPIIAENVTHVDLRLLRAQWPVSSAFLHQDSVTCHKQIGSICFIFCLLTCLYPIMVLDMEEKMLAKWSYYYLIYNHIFHLFWESRQLRHNRYSVNSWINFISLIESTFYGERQKKNI